MNPWMNESENQVNKGQSSYWYGLELHSKIKLIHSFLTLGSEGRQRKDCFSTTWHYTESCHGFYVSYKSKYQGNFDFSVHDPLKLLLLKGLLHPKMKILSLIFLYENQEACDCPIDCLINNIVNAQKSMKSIVRIVHLPSSFNKATRTLSAQRKQKQWLYSTILVLWFSVVPFWRITAGHKQRTLFCVSRIPDAVFSFKLKRKQT